LIPKYKDNKDWNLTINIILEEINELISKYELDPQLKLGLLNQVETHLDKDIEELTGTDKIEILFLNMDDFVVDIEKLIISGKDKQEIRNDMANLIFPLTVFELGELFIYLGRRAFLK
jgi:flagellar motor component MotA